MSNKDVALVEIELDAPDVDFSSYLVSETFEISSQIAHLRIKENKENQRKVNALHARHAVEDVLEMMRYRHLLKDYYDR